MREFIWPITHKIQSAVEELCLLRANDSISEGDFLDRLKALGFPPEARPGDHIRIRFTRTPTVHLGATHDRPTRQEAQ